MPVARLKLRGSSMDPESPLPRSMSMRLSPNDALTRNISMRMSLSPRHLPKGVSTPPSDRARLTLGASPIEAPERTVSMRLTPLRENAGAEPVARRLSMLTPPRAPMALHPRRVQHQTLSGAGGAALHIGDAVWYRDKGARAFLRGSVKSASTSGNVCNVIAAASGTVVQKRTEELHPANAPEDTPDNHANLAHLNEPCVLDSTARRFALDTIYTYVGCILVAVNPFRQLSIYDTNATAAHVNAAGKSPPHVYGVAERAFSRLRSVRGIGQSIVMSGESGAGKTETTRYILRYLAMRASKDMLDNGVSDAVLEIAQITEAFGNAKTRRNDNSSRFGKLVRLSFSSSGQLASAMIRTYLLERSRVTQLAPGERSYHIMYQLLAAEPSSVRSATRLESIHADGCRVLASSKCLTISGVSEATRFAELEAALSRIGLSLETRYSLYAMIAAVVHLTNIEFESTAIENADQGSKTASHSSTALEAASALLGHDVETLGSLLTHSRLASARHETIMKPRSITEAARTRDAIARSVYSRAFAWLEVQLNACCSGDESVHADAISLLDIFGFERFDANGFEQLCINYANEKLHQHFLLCVFKNEQELSDVEGVAWPQVEYNDNEGCVHALEKVTQSGPGVLRLLETKGKMPAATDAGFFEDVNRVHQSSAFFKPVQKVKKLPSEAFIISHYAGNVCYGLENGSWLERESDVLAPTVDMVLCESSVKFIATVLNETRERQDPRRQATGMALTSLSRRFSKELNSLLVELQAGETQFVRCIKPNEKGAPRQFSPRLVLEQLRASGVFEAVELMKKGFPIRLPFTSLYGKFSPSMSSEFRTMLPANFCEKAAVACELLGPGDYAIGSSQLFLRTGHGSLLEQIASMDANTGAPILERHMRNYERRCRAVITLGGALLTLHTKWAFRRRRLAATEVQAIYRGTRSRQRHGRMPTGVGRAALVIPSSAFESPSKYGLRGALGYKELPVRLPSAEPPLPVQEQSSETRAPVETSSLHQVCADDQAVGVNELTLELKREREDAGLLREQLAALKIGLERITASTNENPEASREVSAVVVKLRDQLLDEQRKGAQLRSENDTLRCKNASIMQRIISLEDEVRGLRAGEMAMQQVLAAELEVAEEQEPIEENDDEGAAWCPDALPAWLLEAERMSAADMGVDAECSAAASAASDLEIEPSGHRFTVNISRDEMSGTLGVDIDVWQGCVTVAAIEAGVPAVGKLLVGDQIVGVGATMSNQMTVILKAIVDSPEIVTLHVCRRPPRTVLREEVQMRTSFGTWQYVMATLVSTRMLLYQLPEEALQSGSVLEEAPGAQAELNMRLIQGLEVVDDTEDGLPALALVLASEEMLMIRCTPQPGEGAQPPGDRLKTWHSHIVRMKAGEVQDRMRDMVWHQGRVELSEGLDEWSAYHMVLDENTLRIFDLNAVRLDDSLAKHIVPRSAISKVLRSTGLAYHEWGLQIHLVPTTALIESGLDSLIEARAPNHSEMLRWLATLNLRGAAWHGGSSISAVRQRAATAPLLNLAMTDKTIPEMNGAEEPDRPMHQLVQLTEMRSATTQSEHDLSRRPRACTTVPQSGAFPSVELSPRGFKYARIDLSSTVPLQAAAVELISGWLTLKKEHALGSKRRYCKLVGAPGQGDNDESTGRSQFSQVTLITFTSPNMAPGAGRTLAMDEVSSLKLDTKASTRFVLYATRRRRVRMAADSPEDAARWIDALRAHIRSPLEVIGSHSGLGRIGRHSFDSMTEQSGGLRDEGDNGSHTRERGESHAQLVRYHSASL